MSRRVQRVPYQLDPKGVRSLSQDEIHAILRGADDLIMSGGRTLLTKILKGANAKDVLALGLERSPVYGYYKDLSPDEIRGRIDWVIAQGYLTIEYDGRLPLLVYTAKGWAIEKQTYANELLHGFDQMLATGQTSFDMRHLKDRDRGLILLVLDKVEVTGNPKYIPLLEAWALIDYKQVRQRIRQVLTRLGQRAG